MREDGVLGVGRDRVRVAADHALAVLGEPVAEVLVGRVLRDVEPAGGDVARPRHVEVVLVLRQQLVRAVDRVPHVDLVDHVEQVGLHQVDVGLFVRVDVRDAVAQQGFGHRVAVAVVDADPALVRRVPQDVVGVAHPVDLAVVDHVAPVGDARRVDDVGEAVPGLDVVVGALELRPVVLLVVGEVGVVQWLDQLGRDELAERVRGGEEDVELQLAGPDLREGLVHVLESGDLVVAIELLAEPLHDLLPDVLVPVVELERRAGLGLESVGDRLEVVVDRPGHRRVVRGDRVGAAEVHASGAHGPGARSRLTGLGACREDGGRARKDGRRADGRLQEVSPAETVPPLTRVCHPAPPDDLYDRTNTVSSIGGSPAQPKSCR